MKSTPAQVVIFLMLALASLSLSYVASAASPQGGSIASLLKQASMKVENGDLDGALKDFEAAVAASPNDGYAQNGLGDVLTKLGRPAEAIAHHSDALRSVYPQDQTRTLRGKAYMAMGRNKEAKMDFEQALVLNPNNVEARQLLTGSGPGLVEEARAFRLEAIVEPINTLKKHSSASGLKDFTDIEDALFTETPPEVGWSYFFTSATYTAIAGEGNTKAVMFYHPWSDTAILTYWEYADKRFTITHARLLLGDFVRQNGRPPFELQPQWERKTTSMPPLLSVTVAVGETITASEKMFSKGGVPADRDVDKAMLAAANVRFERSVTSLVRYEEDKKFRPYRELTSLLLAGVRKGDLSGLKPTVPQTSQETFDLIRANSKKIGQYKVVSILKTPVDCFVFLSHPVDPNNVLVLWFQTDNGRYGLREADFINHNFSSAYLPQIKDLVEEARKAQ